MELPIIGIIISGATTIIVGVITLFRSIKKMKLCCCKSECQKTDQELENERQIEIIQKIEDSNIKNLQSIVEIMKLSESPQIQRRKIHTRETVL
jgi:hypothetical protein